tara:strand:- start:337 stop:1461 length:1125 start_codon:yes stop_codon:yes gene_type:complete
MKKIKVKTIFGAHQIYQEIVNNPPKNVEYVGVSTETSQGKYYEQKKWKEKINRFMQKLKIPRMTLVKSGDYDIIHTSRGIIPLNRKPWIMDIEQFTSFVGLHFDIMVKNKFIRWFVQKKLSSKYCKKILCHCDATKQSFLKYLDCSKFKDKLDVLYPSSHIVNIKKTNSKDKRFLFISSIFEQKGGLFVLEAFKRLNKKYPNVSLHVRADVKESIKKEYCSKKIFFEGYSGENILPREKLLKQIYPKGDIFIYTTFCDSFGYSLIDAMVAKMPIIGTNLFAVPEMVQEGRNGFIVDIPRYRRDDWIQEYSQAKFTTKEKEKFIVDLVRQMEKFIKNPELIEKMGAESYKRISKGNLSINERNKKLRRIYENALE